MYYWQGEKLIYVQTVGRLSIDFVAGCITQTEKKVKVTLVQALRLCTGRTAHKGSRGIAVLFHDHGSRRG
jgi:hypothetical protein